MADSRMYIKCTTCKKRFYLAKYTYESDWFSNSQKGFTEWIEDHKNCTRYDFIEKFKLEYE
jgi:hypothetical protein